MADSDEDQLDFRSRAEKAEAYFIPASEPGRLIVRANKGAYGFSLKNLEYDVLNERISKDMILPTLQQANKICEITYAKKKRTELSNTGNLTKWLLNFSILFCIAGFAALQIPLYASISNSELWIMGGIGLTVISIS